MAAKSFFFKGGAPNTVLVPNQARTVATLQIPAGNYVINGFFDSFGVDMDGSLPPSPPNARLGEASLRVTQPGASSTKPGIHTIVLSEDSVHKTGIQEQRLFLSLPVTLTAPATVEINFKNTSSSQNINALRPVISGVAVDSF